MLGLVLLLIACSKSPEDSSSSTGETSPQGAPPQVSCEALVECQLATIEGGVPLLPDDPIVDDYGRALDNLETVCPEPRERLGDMAVTAQELLGNGGVEESLLSIIRNVYASVPGGVSEGEVGPCSDIFSSYVVLRGGEA